MNREMQLRILKALEEIYPQRANPRLLKEAIDYDEFDRDLFYLKEHGLVDVEVAEIMKGTVRFGAPRLTHKGRDFLAADGGLTAMLNVVTVRLHDDTIRDLLVDRVKESGAEASVKGQLTKAIREAPASALSQVANHAVQKGIQQMPDVVGLLQKLLLP